MSADPHAHVLFADFGDQYVRDFGGRVGGRSTKRGGIWLRIPRAPKGATA